MPYAYEGVVVVPRTPEPSGQFGFRHYSELIRFAIILSGPAGVSMHVAYAWQYSLGGASTGNPAVRPYSPLVKYIPQIQRLL